MENSTNFLKLKLQNRFKQALFVGCLTGVFAHLSCLFYFYFTSVMEMFYYDICITIYFSVFAYLIYKDYNLKAIFILASIEMVVHGYLCSYYVGYQCDFIFFVLALPCVFLLDSTWKTWQIISYLLLLTIMFSVNYLIFETAIPVYILPENLITWTSVVMSFTTACIVLIILFYFSKAVNTNEAALKEVCLTLNNKNDENKAMLKEIHHRVKNNLQVINSLLSMQSRFIEDESVVAMFKESQKRIMTIAAIHEKLYNSDNLKDLNAKTHITTLVNELIKSYSISQKIKLKIDIEPIYLGLESLVPLGLIINEIITNSLKHAFSSEEENTITLSLVKKDDALFEMLISDDGIGFDSAILKKGLGQKLISIFVKQLNGSIELLKQKGTTYKIIFQEISHA
jgi:two-component sensor histidine kinase